MDFELGFSKGTVKFQVDDDNLLMVMNPNPVDVEVGGRAEVARSLREPIGAPRLDKVVKPGEKVVIITSDVTRPVPSYDVLPPLLDELGAAGIQDSDITVVFALGIPKRRRSGLWARRSMTGSAVSTPIPATAFILVRRTPARRSTCSPS